MDEWREWGWFGGCAWVKCVVGGGWVDGWMEGCSAVCGVTGFLCTVC